MIDIDLSKVKEGFYFVNVVSKENSYENMKLRETVKR
jgi:hypothetical protein